MLSNSDPPKKDVFLCVEFTKNDTGWLSDPPKVSSFEGSDKDAAVFEDPSNII